MLKPNMFYVMQAYAWDLPITKTAIHRNSEKSLYITKLLECQI